MAQIDRFMIAPISSGLRTDLRPWLIPDDAFAQLNNAYVFRGRVRKRFGSVPMNESVDTALQQLNSRLRINIGTTDDTGALSGTVPGTVWAQGQMFSIGASFFTVQTTGTPVNPLLFAPGPVGETDISGDASGTITGSSSSYIGASFLIGGFSYTVAVANGALTPVGSAPGSGTFNTGTGAFTFTDVAPIADIYFITGAVGTYNTSTGAYTFTGSYFLTDVYFYPATPVIGFTTYNNDTVDNEPTYAFDTQFAYFYSGTGWERLGTAVWSGPDYQLMWGATYRGILNSQYYLFVTNNNNPDLIKYWDGAQWNNLNPVLTQTTRLVTCLMILPFKNRLIALNPVVAQYGSGISQGTTDGTTGNVTVNPVTTYNSNPYMVGDNFLIGTTLFTVTDVTTNSNVALLVNAQSGGGIQASGTFNGTTGELIITGNKTNVNASVYYISAGTPLADSFVRYDNRATFCQNGTPVGPSSNPNATNAWLSDIPGLGGFIESDLKEAITSSEFIKDRLIIYCETSTWELVYTFNNVLPFIWQKINMELGAISTFSTVPFDKVVIGIGDVGIHACNGSNVERIDNNIPDEVFEFSEYNNGADRVCGIRDYYSEMVYWTFTQEETNNVYPNKVLVYNYKNGVWAINDDSITALGAFYSNVNSTWSAITEPWESVEDTWNSGALEVQFRNVIAGNQEGFTFLISRDKDRNAQALQVTNIAIASNIITVTSMNHNLDEGDYIMIENAYGVININLVIFVVQQVIDANTFTVRQDASVPSGTYAGGGTIRRISQIDILTKEFNFYVKDGRNALINKVDFQVDRTEFGAVTVDYFISSSEESTLNAGGNLGTQSLVGNGVLETNAYPNNTFEQIQTRLWHPVYPMADGEFIQLRIYLSDAQMKDIDTAWSAFEMHAMTFYTMPTSSRLQ